MASTAPLREIEEVLLQCGLESSSGLVARVETYLRVLGKWNERMNLTAIQEPRGLLRTLFAESFFAATLLEATEIPILDIGSGAGFPGLAIAVYRPELELILLEPQRKRAAFLTAMRRELGLEGVLVWPRRLEDCVRGDFSRLPAVLTTRAVGDVAQLVGSGSRLLRHAGKVLLFSSVHTAEGTMKRLPSVSWRTPRGVPWNPQHLLLLGEVQEAMFHVEQ
ncbi:MAG: 16S rRNA (guanine(527)-N(7))-methyltransferase RsmG [Acidobacteria bacterium]|nr:16S rRNA (guanine(527)-N(7))-methyltransferase RsmG [Acidobacteriota bacterium]MCI0719205.1 16S rRNA (guanine(527)-N(7))-methyltransferase RsmG [Acidobacteriota bacterium]